MLLIIPAKVLMLSNEWITDNYFSPCLDPHAIMAAFPLTRFPDLYLGLAVLSGVGHPSIITVLYKERISVGVVG